ncbi:MAG: O-acetylhomoserine aminocarboxypropyltransferase/cysteine synthase [Victivallaceae bacterium]|nr:O-acetylhomoserine aminocarboxypropyltransferase/cysteine synthase [Victivallaceae bacterium]
MNEAWKIETRAVQCGYEPGNGDPRVMPITQSTTYKYDSAQEVADLFDLKAPGFFYSRLANPTVEAFEKKIAALEGGVAAVGTSSGQTANALAILNICTCGDHFVAVSSLYGGSVSLFTNTMKKMGISVSYVNPDATAEEITKAFRPNTKALFAEALANPALIVLDFDKFSQIAKKFEVPFIVDNTFPSPVLCRPLELGADIVTHSATKFLDGHATSVGGVIVEGGKFNWKNGKFKEFTEPDESYHGIVYSEAFPACPFSVKARVQWLRDFGCIMAPMNAWLTNLGLETLHIRLERHSSNALALAKFLKIHPKVAWVNYPGLKESPYYELAQKYMPKGAGGVLTFGVKGGRKEGETVMNNLKLAAIVVHVCDVRTGVLHPASMTHRQLNEAEQAAAGVTPDLVRVSVGIENIDDICQDFDQALNSI